MSHLSEVASSSFTLGTIVGGGINWWLLWRADKYQVLLRETKYIIRANDGLITIADLTFAANISPSRARKFLDHLAVQLDADVEMTEQGKVYYRFTTVKTLKLPQTE